MSAGVTQTSLPRYRTDLHPIASKKKRLRQIAQESSEMQGLPLQCQVIDDSPVVRSLADIVVYQRSVGVLCVTCHIPKLGLALKCTYDPRKRSWEAGQTT